MRHPSKLIPTFIIPALFIMLPHVLTIEAAASGTGATTASTLTPKPMLTSSTVFSATVEVIPAVTELRMSETLVVTVSVSTSEGCIFPIYELTIGQGGGDAPIFEYVSPPTATVGPPVSNPITFTLTAVSTGTVTFGAVAYGERYCGDYWQWTYLRGESEPVTVWLEKYQIYLPMIVKNEL
jgi:hypothetical protein